MNKLNQTVEDFMKSQKQINDKILAALAGSQQQSNVNPNLNVQPPANGQNIFVSSQQVDQMLTDDERQNFGTDYVPLTVKIANAAAEQGYNRAKAEFQQEAEELKGQIQGVNTRLQTNDRSRAESEVLAKHRISMY